MGRIRTSAVAALVAGALLAVPAQFASAKLPPSGKYECVIDTVNQYLGDLYVKGNRYKLNRSRWGEMTNPGGNKIRFKSGVWKGVFRGEWERGRSVLEPGELFVEIELTEIDDDFESTYCTKA